MKRPALAAGSFTTTAKVFQMSALNAQHAHLTEMRHLLDLSEASRVKLIAQRDAALELLAEILAADDEARLFSAGFTIPTEF